MDEIGNLPELRSLGKGRLVQTEIKYSAYRRGGGIQVWKVFFKNPEDKNTEYKAEFLWRRPVRDSIYAIKSGLLGKWENNIIISLRKKRGEGWYTAANIIFRFGKGNKFFKDGGTGEIEGEKILFETGGEPDEMPELSFGNMRVSAIKPGDGHYGQVISLLGNVIRSLDKRLPLRERLGGYLRGYAPKRDLRRFVKAATRELEGAGRKPA
ncbi:MAG: hypothetical protein V1835_00980 [Candidatus Micrarchaeota archaeon]